MKQSTAGALWLIFGSALFYFLFNAVAAAQGWPFKLPGVSFEIYDPYAVALVATPVGLFAYAILLCIGAEHARQSRGHSVCRRLPVPFEFHDPDSIFLHAVQLSAFVVAPVLALISLYLKYLGGQFCRRAGETQAGCGTSGYARVGENWDHFTYVPWSLAFQPREFIYQGGPDYWPFWEPIGITFLWVILVGALAWFVACALHSRTA